MEEKKSQVEGSARKGEQVDDSKRNVVAALLGSLGVAALAGCTNQVSGDTSEEPIKRVAEAITGTQQLRWVSWIGTNPTNEDLPSNLRDLDGPTHGEIAIAEGFWEPGDGGGGVFYWDENTDCVDDGGTVIVPHQVQSPTHARTGAAWKRIYVGDVYPEWWGARGDTSTDDTSAINSALNCDGARRVVLRARQYYVGGTGFWLTKNRVQLVGQGRQSLLYFNPTEDGAMMFQGEGLDYPVFQGFSCYLQNTHSKTQITCFSFPRTTSAVTWRDVHIEGFNEYGIERDGAMYDLIERCFFLNQQHATSVAAAICMTTFANAITIKDSRFTGNHKVMIVAKGAGVSIVNCSFEGNGAARSDLGHNFGLNNIDGLLIQGNYIEKNSGYDTYAVIGLDNCKSAEISNNYFSGSQGATTYTNVFIYADNASTRVVVSNNHFIDANNGFVYGTGQIIRAHNNRYQTGTVELTTYDQIMQKMIGPHVIDIGVDYVLPYGTLSLSPGTGWTFGTSSPVRGACLGDHVLVSAPCSLEGAICTAWVSSAEQVSIRIQNQTESMVYISPGDWRVRIIK